MIYSICANLNYSKDFHNPNPVYVNFIGIYFVTCIYTNIHINITNIYMWKIAQKLCQNGKRKFHKGVTDLCKFTASQCRIIYSLSTFMLELIKIVFKVNTHFIQIAVSQNLQREFFLESFWMTILWMNEDMYNITFQ